MSNFAYQKKPQIPRGIISEGRIFIVSKRGCGRLRGLGNKYPFQITPLKPQPPGLVLKNAKPRLPVLEVLPGTSSSPMDEGDFFCPSDEPAPPFKSEAVKRGYFLLSEWRTVRRDTKSLLCHLADITSANLVSLRQSMPRAHGETWTTSSPDVERR